MARRDTQDTQVGMCLGLGDRRPPGETGQSYGIPTDLLDRSLWRLTVIAAVFGLMMLLSVLSNTVLHFASNFLPLPPSTVVVRIVAVVASALMIFVVRYAPMDRQRKLDVGLGFEVVAAGCIAFLEPDMLRAFDLPIGTISSVSLWILLFHLVVPVRPWRALFGAAGSAATVPLAIWAGKHFGVAEVPFGVAAGLYKTTFGTAVVAWFAAHHIYRMGTAVAEARQMGSYRLDDLLGRGGMGEVWRASHALLKRPAAIKLIQPEALGANDTASREVTLKRFEQEAQSTARLQSPHTVTLYDFGQTGDGTFYYAMEYLRGLDLDTLVSDHGPVPPDRAVYLLTQVCHSLHEAHLLGLIHRDIKPANILACCLGPHCDFAKVLDFGLVKHMDQLDDDDPKLTREGMATGTPAYMAPEMALGEGDVDARADLYQLGCVAYWLLTGTLVFSGKTPVAVMAAHINDPPTPVSERTELDVPASLEAVIMDCLAKDPAQRPPTAEAIRLRLEETTLAAGWTPQRAHRWWSVHQPDALGGPR